MLESILSQTKAKQKTWEMLFIGILYYSVACFLSIWVFKEYASIVVILFTVIAILPLIYNMIRTEEEKSAKIENQGHTFITHFKYFSVTLYFFGGLVLASALWYIFAPSNIVSSLFEVQIKTLSGIAITGHASQSFQHFSIIFFNNLKVLIFCVLFSFIYGSGALFILTWNASVVGAAIGYYVRTKLSLISTYTGFEYLAHYFGIFAIGLSRYVIHGIPEILAYFVAGLAGGIISVGLIKREYTDYKFSKIIWDSSNLIIIAVLITFVAAILEVWVTPIIFKFN